MIRITEIKYGVDEPFDDASMIRKISKKLKVKPDLIETFVIVKESIDARKSIQFSYTVDVKIKNEATLMSKGYTKSPERPIGIHERLDAVSKKTLNASDPVIVIGFGPAGIFAALQLALSGLKPIVFEMGEAANERKMCVDAFWDKGLLNTKSNVQFGEGGAGTFSDGKLTTRIKDEKIKFVIDALIEAGAPERIAYTNKPHIGTDVLIDVVQNLRKKIVALGGSVHFNSEITELIINDSNSQVEGVVINHRDRFYAKHVIAATGHSARTFYELLKTKKVTMERKPFAMGVRIEHPQSIINASQYGAAYKSVRLGPAEYKLSYTTKEGRGVYSFCMCPGGEVVGSSSEENRLVVNGMSHSKRDLFNANSALLVTVNPEDFETDDILGGIAFQRMIEAKAFSIGGGNYNAPVQRLGDFMAKTDHKMDAVYAKNHYGDLEVDYDAVFDLMKPTYRPGVKWTDLENVLPSFISQSIYEAIPIFGKKILGFDDPRAIISGVETRSSSPVRIIRTPDAYESVSHRGLYPCGEGAGYAGGITSSAVDGIKVAESIIKKSII